MRTFFRMFACVVCLWVVVAPSTSSLAQAIEAEADKEAILALSRNVQETYIARDWDRFADNFTPDAIWLPGDFPPLVGKPAWWTFVEPFWHSSRIVEMEVTTEEIVVSGDWAYERHNETQVTAPDSGEGETMTFHFKGIWILNRQADGQWKIARYIWNFSPAPI